MDKIESRNLACSYDMEDLRNKMIEACNGMQNLGIPAYERKKEILTSSKMKKNTFL